MQHPDKTLETTFETPETIEHMASPAAMAYLVWKCGRP
jgi:hypothetical protein